MTILNKYSESLFILPCVVDFINYESHAAIDVIQLKGEFFKKDELIEFNGEQMMIFKKIKDYPIQTEAQIEGRLNIRKLRYFCNKIKSHEQENRSD